MLITPTEETASMQKELEVPTLFNVNANERQKVRPKKLQLEEQKQNQAFER
jgi:hypothetical protein